jgi:hypothetical protein
MPVGAEANVRDIGDGSIGPEEFHRNKIRRYTFDPFDAPPRFSANDGFSVPSGTLGAINLMHTNRGTYEYRIIGTGGVITAPTWDGVNGRGLNISMDLTAGDGLEIVFAPNITTANQNRGKHGYRVGTDKGFFARWKLYVTDPAGLDVRIGFRRVEAYSAGRYFTEPSGYSDWVLLAADGGAPIGTYTRRNGFGADVFIPGSVAMPANGVSEFLVAVDGRGKPAFTFNGTRLRFGPPDFTLDAGDVVVPALMFDHAAGIGELTFLQEFESGFLPERSL